MCPAKLVIEPPQDEVGVLDIHEFAITVQIDAVKLDVCVNVGLVYVGGYHKLVLPPGKLHCQLIAKPVGLLRADLSGLEGLDNAVHENIMFQVLPAPSELKI